MAIIGWIVAVVVSSLAIAKYLRERGVITKLQTDLARMYMYLIFHFYFVESYFIHVSIYLFS